ncbi:MAG: hypothetical protein DMG65_09815 [Candidatus Angelobacter sp. Gp1-AA117]|nr:MAG: hypothetical protein DMG65_09815 [Candidatus Angelobacter sp. Gp1-AA117]
MKSTLPSVLAVLLFFPACLPAQTGAGTASAAGGQKSGKHAGTATDGLKGKLPIEGEVKTQKAASAKKHSSTESETPKGTEQAVQNAVRNDEFTLQNGNEYKLDKTINLENTASDHPISVAYQVGNIDQKPAFVTVLVDPKKAPAKPGDAERLFGGKLDGIVHTADAQSTMLACEESRVCVETQKIDGKDVCVCWKCISK